ncbi:carbohydrate ABC transporter permease [Brachybacterium vulturis]|uniref:carbohydrate ABC transporter permease n=1 Tax=Brachybacterium vulturis TaxID=2017484 RepID=UPI0012FD8AE2|nr:sugar ABC transporter permease [Brachybacterium vulturis]
MSIQSATAPPTVRQPRRRPAQRREGMVGWAFMAPFALLFLLVFIVPILASVKESFFRQVAAIDEGCANPLYGCTTGAADEVVTSSFVGLDNFVYVLTSEMFWSGVGRVMLFGAVQVPVMILAALFLAILIDSTVIKRVTVFRLGYFLPFAIPGVIAGLVCTYLYTPELSPLSEALGWFGLEVDFFSTDLMLWSMANITTWTFTGYNMLIFLAALQAIPGELYEAARIDGANAWQVATRIKVPMVRGAAMLAVLLSIIGTVQLFNEPTVLAVRNGWMGPGYTPMMMAYNTAIGGQISPSGVGPASAISLVMAVLAGLLALVYILVQRRLAK